MKLQLFILSFIFVICLKANNEVLEGLRNQLTIIQGSMPGDYQQYIKDLKGTALADVASFTIQEYSNFIKKFNFTQEIERKFTSIVYSYSISFSSFHTTIIHSTFEHTEFIGIARNIQGVITLGFIKATTMGVSTKPALPECKNSGFFARICQKRREQMEREQALKPHEILKIDQALRAYASQLAHQKLDNPPKSIEEFKQAYLEYQKNLLQLRYQGKDCSKVTPNCNFGLANNCFYFDCDNVNFFFRKTEARCNAYIQRRKNECQSYLKQFGTVNECQKCTCINYKLNKKQNLLECAQ